MPVHFPPPLHEAAQEVAAQARCCWQVPESPADCRHQPGRHQQHVPGAHSLRSQLDVSLPLSSLCSWPFPIFCSKHLARFTQTNLMHPSASQEAPTDLSWKKNAMQNEWHLANQHLHARFCTEYLSLTIIYLQVMKLLERSLNDVLTKGSCVHLCFGKMRAIFGISSFSLGIKNIFAPPNLNSNRI